MRFSLRRVLFTAAMAVSMTRVCFAHAATLTLNQALELGLRIGPQLRSARSLADAASSNVDERRAAYLPTLGASGVGSASAERPRGIGSSLSVAVSATLHVPVYDFGRTGHALASAKASHEAALASAEAEQRRARSEIASAYLVALYKQRLRDVAEATLTQRIQFGGLAAGLVKAGIQPPVEEIRASARTESARLDLVSAETDACDANAMLAGLIGLPRDGLLELTTPHLPMVAPEEGFATRAAERLPSVASSEAEARAQSELADGALAQYLPSASIDATPTWNATHVQGADHLARSRSISGQVVITVPLFDLSIGARVGSARAQAASARALADLAQRDARVEAIRASIALRGARQSMDLARRTAKSASLVLSIVQARYVQGLSSPLELIEAESTDSEARIRSTQAELDAALATLRFLTATGGLIREVPA